MFPLRIVPYVIYASETSDVQCAQRVASIGMVLLQYGHTLVVGAAGSSSFLWPRFIAVFTIFIRQNRTDAMIMKLMTDATNALAKPETSVRV